MRNIFQRGAKYLVYRGGFNFIPDKQFLKLFYWARTGKRLDLEHPRSFNEKMQWLKLYDHRPEYTTMVDKYEAKKYVAEKIGDAYIIPTLGVWDRFEDIDFDSLPDQFVLKCTHDSGSFIICQDKSKLDLGKAKEKIEKKLSHNYYFIGREWPYKNVKHRIIAEQFMGSEIIDYKLFCFDGELKVTLVCSERSADGGFRADYFDASWNHVDIGLDGHPAADVPPTRPKQFEKMASLAKVLSEGIPFARVDFYEVNDAVYWGEITLFPCNGIIDFVPEKWNQVFGEWLRLPEKKQV